MPKHLIQSERVHLRLNHASDPTAASVERIDDDHANPERAWREMGEPKYLSEEQVNQLQAVSCLTTEPLTWELEDGTVHLELDLPAHSVAAITLEALGQARGGI